jgi:predicted nucleic acid-binding protein
MKIYLDSSALVKLVKREAESNSLRQFLQRHGSDRRVTSALARVEVVRALAGGGPAAVAHARRQLARLDQINLHSGLFDAAAILSPSALLRSLDAIHLASARTMGADLRAVVTYDQRMNDAAVALGLAVEAPA